MKITISPDFVGLGTFKKVKPNSISHNLKLKTTPIEPLKLVLGRKGGFNYLRRQGIAHFPLL